MPDVGKTDVSAGGQKRLALFGTTCCGNSREHMPWQLCGPHAIAFLGSTCDENCGEHIRIAVLGNMCNLNSGDHKRCYCRGPHTMKVMGKTWDVISEGATLCQFWCRFWGQRR